jgi:hypothetical protein
MTYAPKRGKTAPIPLPVDYPQHARLARADLFRVVLGNAAPSTFARYLVDGVVPPPDARLGNLNLWRESTMARTVEKLIQPEAV